MRFPAGLTARLWGQRISQSFHSKPDPAILYLSPFVKRFPSSSRYEGAVPGNEWHTPEACVQAADQAGARVVWLGGTEPLLHPAIGKVTTALVQSGRYVFLDTGAADLRKRVHEFQPAERFFFAFQLCGDDVACPGGAENGGFQNVTEALRVVKLSGFFACVHVCAGARTSAPEMGRLFASLEASRVDGIVVSSGGACATLARDAMLSQKAAEITGMIPARRWRKFSRMLEVSYLRTTSLEEQPNVRARSADACEESA
jgi:hypothetical protein